MTATAEVTKVYGQIIAQAKNLSNNQSVHALLLVDEKNTIIYEKIGEPSTASTLFKSASMAKSLTSILFGFALCEGVIHSIDDKAGDYSTSLAGTAYGEATFRQLLMMASGGSKPIEHGMPRVGLGREIDVTHTQTIRRAFQDYGVNQPNPAETGSFNYKALDTEAVSIALTDTSKIPGVAYLEDRLWKRIGAEQDAMAMLDGNRDRRAAAGHAATARDWVRVAIFVRDIAGTPSCLGRYLRDATSPQLANPGDYNGGTFRSYGYQFWTEQRSTSTPNAWFNGYGGQRIGIDLKGGKIMVLLSRDTGGVGAAYKLFADFVRNY